MRREFAALAGVAGVAAIGGAAWWFSRSRDSGAAGVDVTRTTTTAPAVNVASAAPRRVGKVFRRERADLLHADLRAALDAYAVAGPWPIIITSGPREGAAAEAEQAGYFRSGASKARTLADTPHGRRGAFDFAVVRQVSGDAVVSSYLANEHPELYRQVGEWFEARGLVWGGRWLGFPDAPHVELSGWRALPYPPKGNA